MGLSQIRSSISDDGTPSICKEASFLELCLVSFSFPFLFFFFSFPLAFVHPLDRAHAEWRWGDASNAVLVRCLKSIPYDTFYPRLPIWLTVRSYNVRYDTTIGTIQHHRRASVGRWAKQAAIPRPLSCCMWKLALGSHSPSPSISVSKHARYE